MSGVLYQVNDNPIMEDEYVTEDLFIDNGFVGQFSIAESVHLEEDYERENSILDLIKYLGKYGASYEASKDFARHKDHFVFSEGFRKKYFTGSYDEFKELAHITTIADFADEDITYKIKSLIDDTFDDYVYYRNTLYTLDNFIRQIYYDKRYYIGATIYYK